MNAAALSQQSSPSSTVAVAPSGPETISEEDHAQQRGRAGLGEPEQDLEDEVAHRLRRPGGPGARGSG